MNKKITALTIMFLMVSLCLFPASKKEKQELYLKAVAEKDPRTKMDLLKAYAEKFGDTKDKFLRFIYLNLADTSYKMKSYDESIQYGEIALEYSELDPQNKLRIYFSLANAYKVTNRDLDKALTYAGMIIDVANSLIEAAKKPEQDPEKSKQFIKSYEKYYIAPSYKLQSMIYYDKGESQEADTKALQSYKFDESESTYNMIFSLAVNLFKKKQYQQAINIAEQILNNEKLKYREAYFMATAYNNMKKKDKAIDYYELAYKTKPKLEVAMKIARLVHKTNPNKAVKFFADAFILSESDRTSDAFRYLESLYFNKVAKDKSPEEQEKGFKAIISAAKTRLSVGGNETPLEQPTTSQDNQ
ncbi:MAG: hypothetical protein GY940_15630 [bacterium]|nr:hypothetical protein [bacterium]